MYIKIKKFIYDGWNSKLYCFDRETYSFVDISTLDSDDNDMYYKRYISLPEIDYLACEDEYINQLNNNVLYRKYKRDAKGFFHFVETNCLTSDWYKYQSEWVCRRIVERCVNNDLVYDED